MKAQTAPAVAFTVRDNPEAPGGKNGFMIYRGSKSAGTREATGRVVITDKNPRVKLWRSSVMLACRPNGEPLVRPGLDGPLIVRLMFSLRRPPSVSVTKRPYPTVKPDVDNLVKPTFDAITTSGLWKDDNLVVSLWLSKAYAGHFHPDGTPALDVPGCVVDIFRVLPATP